MNTFIFHSVNACLCFVGERETLMIDGIHAGEKFGYSNTPDLLAKQLIHQSGIFQNQNQILFTHFHEDHFDRGRLDYIKERNPHLLIYGPGLADSNIKEEVLDTHVHQLVLTGGNVLTKNTMHDGENWKKDINQSFLVQRNGESFFIASDANLTKEDADEFLPFINGTINAGFFNVYQLVYEQCLEFIRSLPFERIFLYHLPFKQDDKYNYLKLARQIARNAPSDLPDVEILPAMSWIDNKQPLWNGNMEIDHSGKPDRPQIGLAVGSNHNESLRKELAP